MLLNAWITPRTYSGGPVQQVRDVRHGLALRRHQHHDRSPQLERVLGGTPDPPQPPPLGHRNRADEHLRARPISSSNVRCTACGSRPSPAMAAVDRASMQLIIDDLID
jgi:hypothetical protein